MSGYLKVTSAVLTGVNLGFVLCLYILPFISCSKKYRTVMSWFNFWFVFHFSIFLHTKSKNHTFFLPAYMCLVGFSVSTKNMQLVTPGVLL